MHVLLFGGSFDPPHDGHQKIVKHALEKGIADEVWYVPCADHPFAKTLTPAHHRLAMLRSMQSPHTRLCTVELKHKGKSYTYDTLRCLTKAHPQHTFSWLMGSDQLPDFQRWKNIEEILKRWKVFVYPRTGFPYENKERDVHRRHDLFLLSNTPSIDISSTDIRQRCTEEKSITTLVDPRIARYIEYHGLYTMPTAAPHKP